MKKLLVYLSVVGLIMLFSLSESWAAPYYEGKTIRLIVGNSPGGGYDRLARLFARYLPKYIPGKPTVIVENMPGGATIIAANYVYNVARPNGLIIGALGRGLPFAQLLKAEGVKFDMAQYGWIGSTAVEATVLTLRSDLPYKTAQDLIKASAPIVIGTTGPAESSHQFATLLKEFLGMNLKLINYLSGAEINLAIERKEVDGRASSYSGIKPYIERGVVRPVIRGRVAEPGVEKLPVDEDLCSDPIGKTIMSLRSAPERMGRPYVTAPKTPADIMKTLTTAFAKVAKDPEVLAESRKLLMQVEYVSGEECLKITNNILHQPEKIVREVAKYIKL